MHNFRAAPNITLHSPVVYCSFRFTISLRHTTFEGGMD